MCALGADDDSDVGMTDAAPTNAEPYTGQVGHLSPEQQAVYDQVVAELKADGVFSEERHDAYFICRFLRARKFDPAKSKQMIADYEKWRKEFGVEEIVRTFQYEDADRQVQEIYPRFYHGVDKEGRPIYIEVLGKLDVKKMMGITTTERILQGFVYEFEKTFSQRFPGCSQVAGRHIETSFTILDLKGVGLFQLPSVQSILRDITHISKTYYPECVGKIFIINAPFIFSASWRLITPLIDEVTVKKISIMGGSFQTELLKHVDAAQLPVEYGGTCSCANGCGSVEKGPWLALPEPSSNQQ